MKQTSEKIAETFGQACHDNDVIGLCITINDKNNTNAIGLNATAREAGFMIRELVRNLAMEFSSNEAEYADFCAEFSKSLNLPKRKKLH